MRKIALKRATRLPLAAACLGLVLTASPSFAAPPSPCVYLAKQVDAQPAGPVFLPSFPSEQSGVLHGAAYLYDNAVTTIALVACGDRGRAARIGDAMVVALKNDRYWHDGRLRNAYLAGSVNAAAVKLPGWWDDKLGRWMEDAYQVGSDNGNMAWTILALLALDQQSGSRQYRDAAVRIGNWVIKWRSARGAGGFTGGVIDEKPAPIPQRWKSTEHNTDLAAAFSGLAQVTGDKKWLVQAKAARRFVRAMWRPSCRCFDVGTVEDGIKHNHYIALDAQILPLLALPDAVRRYGAAVVTANSKVRDGDGFAYGEVRGGIWTEGTEQAALFMKLAGREAEAQSLVGAADKMRTPDGGYYAASTKELPTGMLLDTDQTQTRQYFHIPHLAAVAWAALVGRRYNPFTRNSKLP